MKKLTLLFALSILIVSCAKKQKDDSTISFNKEQAVEMATDSLFEKYGESVKERIDKGVFQAATLWTEADGSEDDFVAFCQAQFIAEKDALKIFFEKVSRNFEILNGNFNKINVELKLPVHKDGDELTPIDQMFGAYSVSSHLIEDLFNNKIAFAILLNFPFYTLEEKTKLGPEWTRLEWAYARMGDLFTSRIPAELIQNFAQVLAQADAYISEYNIYMGYLLDAKGNTLFPENMKLISHWGLRDELKSHYGKDAVDKQQMVYEVMKRIINQSIPQEVINSNKYHWDPVDNKVLKDGKEVPFKKEDNVRYQWLLDNFLAQKAMDEYNPSYPNYIQRSFDEGREMSQQDVEKLFIDLCSADQVKQVAAFISKRLGRPLEPFDIWYDGFKSRSSFTNEYLDDLVKGKYPSKDAFEEGLPVILTQLGFSPELSEFIPSKIIVDASRGAGHAWGAEMKSDKARLRTRVGEDGMDYKGYNIAVHEFGHNVEQTISLHEIDYYLLRGVPSTAFTEALAFIFQKRDLELLGLKDDNPDKMYLDDLDLFWSTFEIMGVSLVDMNVWKWLYAHPDATAAELKEAVIDIAIEVWNSYFAEAFGIKDQPILAIYSHMIDYPLYLAAYPIGHVIDFQVEKQLSENNFADEVLRMYSYGRIIPQLWMKNAVGREISTVPMLEAVNEALLNLTN